MCVNSLLAATLFRGLCYYRFTSGKSRDVGKQIKQPPSWRSLLLTYLLDFSLSLRSNKLSLTYMYSLVGNKFVIIFYVCVCVFVVGIRYQRRCFGNRHRVCFEPWLSSHKNCRFFETIAGCKMRRTNMNYTNCAD